MTEKFELQFEEETGIMVFPKSKDECGKEDFIDDMVAHIYVGDYRFCVDMNKETTSELERLGKWLRGYISESRFRYIIK